MNTTVAVISRSLLTQFSVKCMLIHIDTSQYVSACMLSEYSGYSRTHLFSRFDLCAVGSNLGVISFHVAPFQHALYCFFVWINCSMA